MSFCHRNIQERVKAGAVGSVGRVEVYNILFAVLWNGLQQFKTGISMRFNQTHAIALIGVIKGHIKEQGGLSHAGLSDGVYVRKTVLEFDAKKLVRVAPVGVPDGGVRFQIITGIFHIHVHDIE